MSFKSLLFSASFIVILSNPLPVCAGEAMPPFQDSIDIEVSNLKTGTFSASVNQKEMGINEDTVSPKSFGNFMGSDPFNKNALKLLQEKIGNPQIAFSAADAIFQEEIKGDLSVMQFAQRIGFAASPNDVLNQLKTTSYLEKLTEILEKTQFSNETIYF